MGIVVAGGRGRVAAPDYAIQPRGLWCVGDRNVPFTHWQLDCPWITGYLYRCHWDQIEPTEGVYTGAGYAELIHQYNSAVGRGKRFMLGLMAGMLSPAWALVGTGPLDQCVCGGALNGERHDQPLPFNTTYTTRLKNLLTQLATVMTSPLLFVTVLGLASVSLEMGLQDT